MGGYVCFRTGDWEINLPHDWIGKGDTGGGEFYFESADGTKGVYVAAWVIPQPERRSAREVAQSFRSAERSSLHHMADYEWEIVTDEAVDLGSTTITLTDAWAPGQSYRIASKVLLRMPLVVRAAFHDYLCEDFEASQQFFAPLIESLRAQGTPH